MSAGAVPVGHVSWLFEMKTPLRRPAFGRFPVMSCQLSLPTRLKTPASVIA